MTLYLTSLFIFTAVIMSLVFLLYLVQTRVVRTQACSILINDDPDKALSVSSGTNLLTALSNQSIFIPSACGGGGSCAMCKVEVLEGGGEVLPTELPHLSVKERKSNVRLGCQIKVKSDIAIKIPDEIFSIQKFTCTVVSNKNVATFIKELILKLPDDMTFDFEAGGYIQTYIPPYSLSFKEFEVEDEYRDEWDKYNLWDLKAKNEEEVFRAYSMANYPGDKNVIILNVRIATPPPNTDHLPGIGSSYIFNLKPGDKLELSGAYGEFFAKKTEREMCFIGGGAGMAPMRSHIFDQLKRLSSTRKITFWYGARSLREMFYDEDFKELQEKNPNFTYHVALSDPKPEDNWTGHTGFIHNVLESEYLGKHEDPTDVEYYLCGPPMMLQASMAMLDSLGVEKDMVAFDDFGS